MEKSGKEGDGEEQDRREWRGAECEGWRGAGWDAEGICGKDAKKQISKGLENIKILKEENWESKQ